MAALIALLQEVETEKSRKRQRVFRDRTRQLETLNDEELHARYRMPRVTLLKLVASLSESLASETQRSNAISPETKVLVGMRYLSKGGFFLELGDLHGTSKASVSRIVHDVVRVINANLPDIRFTTDPPSLTKRMTEFYKIAGFPKVIGCIDGTLVAIRRPPDATEAAYVCRKGYHAINVQASCDANLRLTNVVAKWPGSCHDASILRNSVPGEKFEQDKPAGYLLGDSGYGCKSWLLTPILQPSTRGEERYNTAHVKTRNTVERTFGVLKSRFRCLHKSTGPLAFSPAKCCNIVVACCKLHNYCLDEQLPEPEHLPEFEEDANQCPVQEQVQDGHQARQALIQSYF